MADLSDDDSENLEKDERRDLELLQRIADALVEFYGLGEVPLLMVDDVDGHPSQVKDLMISPGRECTGSKSWGLLLGSI